MSCPSPRAVLFAASLSLLLLLVAACDPPPSPPKVPVRELPPPATSLLVYAPAAYGLPTPIALPDDQGSANAQAMFAGMAGLTAVHEPALDLVAAVVGKTYADEQELPADALLQWLYWKCGAVSIPGPVNVFVAPPGAEPYFQEHLRRLAAIVSELGVSLSFGVARIPVGGYVAQTVAIGFRVTNVAPIGKGVAPGGRVPLRISPTKPYADLTLYVDQGGASVLMLPMKQEADGTFSSEVPLPPAPGRYFVEIVGIEVPPDGDVQKGWRMSLLWLPLYAGVGEPLVPDDFIRRPQKNHPDANRWFYQITNAFNDERVRLGRAPLGFEPQASALAQQRSDELSRLSRMPAPDQGLFGKLADAGLPARNISGYIDQIEFVSEYITLRLLRPAARHALLDPAMTTFALGLTPRGIEPGRGRLSSVEYVFERIRIEPPKERERLLGELDAAEIAAGGKAFTRSDPLSRAAQETVEAVCRGGPMPTDARGIFERAVGLDRSLLRRTAVPWIGYDPLKAQIPGIHDKVKGEKYTHAGVGVCQGTVEGHKGAAMALVLFAGP